jgi:flagellar hook assembly protein FlgD/outer membrane protein OmpA-like peptidoglycan-associated protein
MGSNSTVNIPKPKQEAGAMKNRAIIIVMACTLGCMATPTFAQNALLDLYSPAFLGQGANVASIDSPQADAINPAASGGAKRITADLSYIGLPGLGASSGWGNALNAGITYPTPIGVFTGSARWLSSTFPSLNIGSLGVFNFSFAKDIYPHLNVGAGLAFQIGQSWGLGLDLGFLHSPGDVAFLKDFRWGAALRQIGKGNAPLAAGAGVGTTPPAFTPDIGTSFSFLKTTPVTISLASDLSFPSFQDVAFGIDAGFSFFSIASLQVSYSFDLGDTLARINKPFPLSFGIYANIPVGSPGDLTVTTAAAPMQDGVWGFGLDGNFALGKLDRTPPTVTLGSSEPAYVSPGTSSSQGSLSVPLTVTDERYVTGYRLVVKDADGKTVRTIEVSDKGPSSKGFQNFLDRLAARKKSIDVPPAISWDGKDDSGAQVPDGSYTYTVEAWDDNNNLTRTDSLAVAVDTAAPAVTVSTPYLEFSPSGEGTKGSLAIEQSGSTEDLWVGTIFDSTGKEVRQFRWTNDAPKSFSWQGKDSNGKLAPDGTYDYKITATDRAGNTGSAELTGIVINTQATPVSLATDLPAFSPNGDGVKDVIHVIPTVKVTAGIDKWTLAIKDQSGAVKRTFSGAGTVPGQTQFDGKDDVGTLLPEGTYVASLNVIYRNGHTPTADSPPFLLRVTPPSATVGAPWLEFSPDGVGTKTALGVTQNGSLEILWQGVIQDSARKAVKSFRWDESAPKSFTWDGRDEDGKLVPDGTYSYRLASTDPAGNTGTAALDGIVVNTATTPVSLSVDFSAFSPNGDGAKDTLHFSLNAPVTKGIEKWSLLVKDGSGKARRTFTGSSVLPKTQELDGKDDDGVVLPEGAYTATLALQYANGHVPSADSPSFVIDVTAPVATVSSDYAVFSPIGEGTRNLLTFSQTGSKDAAWAGTVLDAAGKAARTATWKGRPDAKFVFDGHGDDGKLLPDGKYTYTLAGLDSAGNKGASTALPFEIDTTATPVIVSTDLTYFSPNGDGVRDTLRIVPSLKVTTGVDTFALRIKNDKGTVIRTVSGQGVAPVDFVWDGLDDAKIKAPDGQFTAELSVLYRNGNHPTARTNPFFIDTVFPTITLSADALLFSPTEDSALKAVAIRQSSSDEDLWTGQIGDAAGKAVRTFSWKGKAADVSWDGKDDNGNAAPDGTYRYSASSTDKAGNKTLKTLDGIIVDTRPTPVSVKALADGFSPNADGFRDTMGLSLSTGLSQGISSWKLTMVEAAKGAQKTFSGQSQVPASLVWDGKTDAGSVVEGTYTARLEVAYAKGNRPVADSAPFLLSVTPPKVDLSAGPYPFSPDGDGYNDVLTIALKAADVSPIDSWDITILDPESHPFTSFSGKGALPESFTWDGLSVNGELVQSAEDYAMTATVRDALGNTAKVTQKIPIDVLVFRDGDKLKVRVTAITFAANTADYVNVEADRKDKNMQTLARLAQIFKKYSAYKIQIEGHAVMVNWDNPVEGQKEQASVLIPLSKARADAIKSALAKLGIDAARITTNGLGGAVPIVPFSDLENRWKDRRVEFILVR